MAKTIPVIDFDCFRLEREEADEARFQTLVDDVHKALTTVGFMYVINHGVPGDKIQELFAVSRKFFNLPDDEKRKYAPKNMDVPSISGYYGNETERTSREREWDLKQCFNYSTSKAAADMIWPDHDVPGLRPSMEDFFATCIKLYQRILDVIGHALRLEDPQYFRQRHSDQGTTGNCSILRTLYYQAPDFDKVKDNQLRCGEHTDHDAMTLLFQDMQGGLEVQNVEGQWIQATPVEGAIVVNTGALMQRWTGNRLIASVHRVVLPSKPVARQSIAFFGKPDDEKIIECIDGSDKYQPITFMDFYKENTKYMY